MSLAAISIGNAPLSLCLSMYSRERWFENIYFPACLWDAVAVDISNLFGLFVVAGLWVWVPGGCRWEDIGFGKLLRSLFYVFPHFLVSSIPAGV